MDEKKYAYQVLDMTIEEINKIEQEFQHIMVDINYSDENLTDLDVFLKALPNVSKENLYRAYLAGREMRDWGNREVIADNKTPIVSIDKDSSGCLTDSFNPSLIESKEEKDVILKKLSGIKTKLLEFCVLRYNV